MSILGNSLTYTLIPFTKISQKMSFHLIWMITFGAISLLVSSLLVFGISQYNQRKNEEFTEMQLLVQKESDKAEYYKMLQMQYENQRILIHDIKKHLQSIDLLILFLLQKNQFNPLISSIYLSKSIFSIL